MPVIFPVHPRTQKRLQGEFGDMELGPDLRLIEPVGYLDMLQLLTHARLTLTDSGGLQKEAFFLDCPCVTLREETEWVETVDGGGNVVAGMERDRVLEAVSSWEQRYGAAAPDFASAAAASFGDGHAAESIVRALLEYR